ncbi:MAG: hypothetical protein QW331_04025 [Candidatus Woesearchaeota archaeon]
MKKRPVIILVFYLIFGILFSYLVAAPNFGTEGGAGSNPGVVPLKYKGVEELEYYAGEGTMREVFRQAWRSANPTDRSEWFKKNWKLFKELDMDPEELGELDQYDIEAIKAYMREMGFSVQDIEGILSGAGIYTVNGRPTLQLKDGTQIDLKSDTVIRIGFGGEGNLQLFEDDQGNLLIQPEGLIYTKDRFSGKYRV